MESLFLWKSTRARHRTAPLLKEREEFLTHLLKQGCSLQRTRTIASFVIAILQVMEMTELREVASAETLQDLCQTDIDAYLDSKRLIGWKERTLATQCQAMRTFLRYAELQG